MLVVGLLVTIVGDMLSQAYRVAEANIVAPFLIYRTADCNHVGVGFLAGNS